MIVDVAKLEDAVMPNAMNPKPCDALWFAGGDIVLASGEYLFRVHKDVLSLQSSVFRDLFDLPTVGEQGAGMVPEMYEGLPLVTLAGDNGRDVMHLLRAAYEREYYDKTDNDTPLEVITALLLLSTKYDLVAIKRDVISHIRRIYPTTYDENDKVFREFHTENDETGKYESLFGFSKSDCDFPLLQAAFTANAEILLPGLFYACATHHDSPLSRIVDEYPQHCDGGPGSCFMRLVLGREKLSYSFAKIVSLLKRMRDAFFCIANVTS